MTEITLIDEGCPTSADGPAVAREIRRIAERLWAAAGRRPATWAPEVTV